MSRKIVALWTRAGEDFVHEVQNVGHELTRPDGVVATVSGSALDEVLDWIHEWRVKRRNRVHESTKSRDSSTL